MNQSNWELDERADLGYGQLFTTLWNRRYWFAGVFGGVLAVAVPLSLMKQPVYQSTMQFLPESSYQTKDYTSRVDNQYLESQFTDTSVEIDYVTQLKVLKSSEILKKVIDKLGWYDPELSELELIEALRESLAVSQIVDQSNPKETVQTKIIQTEYYGSSPTQTKEVLEAIGDVYLQYNLDQQEKRLKDGLAFIDKQIPQAQVDLKKAESTLTELSKKYNIIAPQEEAVALKQNITDISQQREELKAQSNETRGNSQTLEEQLGLSANNSVAFSRLSQSTRYQNLLDGLQQIEIQLAAKRIQHQDGSPIVQNLIDQKTSQRDLLKNEAERILGEVPADFDSSLDSMLKQGQLVGSDTQFIDEITQARADLTGITEREQALAETEAQLRQRLAEFPELIARYRDLTQEAEVKREALQRLREAKQELEIELNRGGFDWQVIEQPQLGEQIAPNLTKDLMLSLVVASFLGVSAAFAKEVLDSRISNLKETERQTRLPVLGSTPSLSLSSSNRFLTKLPFRAQSHATTDRKTIDIIQWQPFREAVDVIYENLKLSGVTSSFRSLAITSATTGEGKSTFTLGLALSAARRGHRVLAIDADLRRPSLHQTLNISNQSGLTDYLAGDTKHPEIERVFLAGENIDFICSGPTYADPVKLLCSSNLEKLIQKYQQDYDLIIVDTPPAIGMVDAIKIASICDSALLMMRLQQLKSSELTEVEALLSKLNVLGIVANDSKEYETKRPYLLPQHA